ncbi:MAG: hypothetical protein JW839_13545 [Candidatus Lokiarchaeota archaeon]|nr:hypothetical protein [Candidatus Lokiarchaeota archaeon]
MAELNLDVPDVEPTDVAEDRPRVPRRASPSPLAGALLAELASALPVCSYLLACLPFGFCSLAGINVPYTEGGFLGGFLLMILAPAFVFTLINKYLMRIREKKGLFKDGIVNSRDSSVASTIAYVAAFASFCMFIISQDGWHSEIGHMLLYLGVVFSSGTCAMLAMPRLRIDGAPGVPGIGIAVALAAIGVLYVIFAPIGFHYLLLIHAICVLAAPPLLAVARALPQLPPRPPERARLLPRFAWFEKAFKEVSQRGAMTGLAWMLAMVATSNFLASVIFLKIPSVSFQMQALAFFLGAAGGIAAFGLFFKEKPSELLMLLTGIILVACLVLNEAIPAFANNPASLAISGAGLGAAIVLLLKFQQVRSNFPNVSDQPAARVSGGYYVVFLAALAGLFCNLTVDFTSLGSSQPGSLPVRAIFQGIFLAICLFSVLGLHSQAVLQGQIERGEVTVGTRTMADFIKAQQERASGPAKQAGKEKQPEKSKKQMPANLAFMAGGRPSAPEKVPTRKADVRDPGLVVAGSTSYRPPPVPQSSQLVRQPAHEGVRKIKALLMISKRVKVENVREALNLDEETCGVVLDIWAKELEIEVAGGFVDFKDIEVARIVSILESFLAEWNKPAGDGSQA